MNSSPYRNCFKFVGCALLLVLSLFSGGAAATVVPISTAPFMGLWYNPNESGWGMSITQHNSTNFAAIYSYDQAGQPTWYVISSCPLISVVSCTGDIYKVAGGNSPDVPWTATGKVVVSSVGTGTLTFIDTNHAIFDYILNGIAGSKYIEREFFDNGTAQFAVDYTDMWWNPNESGWGVALTQDHGMVFAAWYAYDVNGKAIWYVASACTLTSTASGNSCTGEVYQVTGGSPLTTAWNANIAVKSAGSVTFTFSDGSNGIMSYSLNGVAGTRAISREPF